MNKKIISIIGAVAAVFAVLGGLWAFEDRYAKSIQIAQLEVQVVQSLQQYNMQQMKVYERNELKSQYRFYQFLYDKLGYDMMEIARQLRMNPNDQVLRQDYVNVKNQRDSIKTKMDVLMGKIK